MTRRSLAAQALALTLTVVFFATELLAVAGPPSLPNPGNPGVSRQQQIQVGQQAEAEVYKQMPVLPDSNPLTQYVQQLGRKLVAQIPQQYSWPYNFHVIEQKEINAFALPGGPIFINVGTITAADNEAELAGVMSHEMSHVYMQHSAKMIKQNTAPSILAGLGQVLGSMIGGVGGAIASLGGQISGGLLSMKYSRADEAQADAVGAIIMYKAGYNPKSLAQFFQKLETQGGAPPQFLSDHPSPGNRVAAVDAEIKDWPPKNYVNNSQSFVQARAEAQRIPAYTAQQISDGAKSGQWARQNQQSGAVPKNVPVSAKGTTTPANTNVSGASPSQVRPSGSYTSMNNNVFSMRYPNNWQIFNDQQGSGLTVGPAAGVSQGAIAYGVVINSVQPQNGESLDQVTQQLIQSIQQSNQGETVSGSPQQITVNGAPGEMVYMYGNSPVQQNGQALKERDWVVTVQQRNGGVLALIFIAPDPYFGQFQPTYETMLRSLHLK